MSHRKIIGVLRPFERRQSFYVYEDGNRLEMQRPTIDEVNNTVFALSDKYDVTQVDLTGPKQYSRGIKKKLELAEMEKSSTNKLTINVI